MSPIEDDREAAWLRWAERRIAESAEIDEIEEAFEPDPLLIEGTNMRLIAVSPRSLAGSMRN
jgi:hypothetical protein